MYKIANRYGLTINELCSINGIQRNKVLIPSNEYLIPGRLLSTESYPRVLHLLRDLSGQGIVSRWPKGVWENQEMGKILEEYLPGIGVTAREKNRFFNFVWEFTFHIFKMAY